MSTIDPLVPDPERPPVAGSPPDAAPSRTGCRSWAIAGVASLLIGGVAVFGGRANGGGQGSQPPNDANGPPNGGNPNGAFAAGKVVSVDGSSITIANASGTNTTVATTASTTVMIVKNGSVGDIKVGDTI